MFRKYVLVGFSILYIIGEKEKLSNRQITILSSISEVLQASFGGGLPFSSGGQPSTVFSQWMPTIAASSTSSLVTTCLFAFCPISFTGITIAFGSILIGGYIIECSAKWIVGAEQNFVDVFARQIPKSIGAGIYIALSYSGMSLMFLAPILALIALNIGINCFFCTNMTMLYPISIPCSILYGLSIWLACGYQGNLVILGLFMSVVSTIALCIYTRKRKYTWGGLAFGSGILFGLHVFGFMCPALTICTIILLQVTSFLGVFGPEF